MPIYSMQNKETLEEFEVNLKYAELNQYLEANPQYKQIFTKFPATGDPVRLGVKHPDNGFKDVLKNVKHHHRKNTINDF
jgi:hypothetical protein